MRITTASVSLFSSLIIFKLPERGERKNWLSQRHDRCKQGFIIAFSDVMKVLRQVVPHPSNGVEQVEDILALVPMPTIPSDVEPCS